MVVDAVDTDGIRVQYSQGLAAELTVSAPVSVGRGDLATPAVASLAAYFVSLDQYRQRLLVPGSVARNVRDLIKSLAIARLPQLVFVWNGIGSR